MINRISRSFVEKLLIEYKERRYAEKVFGKEDKELLFLEHCLNCLENYERDLLEKLYIEELSVRAYARLSGFSRNFIDSQRNKLLDLLEKYFRIKNACEA